MIFFTGVLVDLGCDVMIKKGKPPGVKSPDDFLK